MLHWAAGNRGVVICGPLSDEALNSNRALLFLGEQLARAGLPTLRLNYYGTGDSAGQDEEPDRYQQWLDSIGAAARWLCEKCGVRQVTLIGHRVGAALAARAACDLACVDSLVLLNPIGGRQFLHEMTLAARISQRVWQTSHKLDDGTWFESHGLRIDHSTRDALNALDLRKLPGRPAERALLLAANDGAATRGAADALDRTGVQVATEIDPTLDRMQRDSHEAGTPDAAFDRATEWLQRLPVVPAPVTGREPPPSGRLSLAACTERPIVFGPAQRLFGILTEPAGKPARRPAVLIANTSANPRWGNARFAVDLARALAADGIATLRMDASGMGDASISTGELGRPYAELTTQDLLHGVTELARRVQRPVVIAGVCSGAYHALQAAARHLRVGGLVLVNLQRFVWQEGDPPDAMRRSALRPNHYYLRNIFSAQAWYRLIRADFDVANLLRVFTLRLLRRALAEFDPALTLLSGGRTRVGRVRQAMQRLAARDVRILYVLGHNDPGVEELAEYFGPDGWRLRRLPNVCFRLLEDADHTLGVYQVRAKLIEDLRAWYQQNWPPSMQAPAVQAPVRERVTMD